MDVRHDVMHVQQVLDAELPGQTETKRKILAGLIAREGGEVEP